MAAAGLIARAAHIQMSSQTALTDNQENLYRRPGERQDPRLSTLTVTDGGETKSNMSLFFAIICQLRRRLASRFGHAVRQGDG